MSPAEAPVWTTSSEVPRVIRFHLWKTLRIALIVGTILFCINQLDVVLSGGAGVVVWIKVGVTYCVPFVVSNLGVIIGARRHATS